MSLSETVLIDKEVARWEQFLNDFEGLPRTELNRTFMQIGGYPHYENVCSNILSFFFDPENEHGLQDLCYRALMQCVREKNESLVGRDEVGSTSVDVEREVNCAGKRLDLVLTSDQFVVGIENKIWHHLNNDLQIYKKEVARRAKETGMIESFDVRQQRLLDLVLEKVRYYYAELHGTRDCQPDFVVHGAGQLDRHVRGRPGVARRVAERTP